MLSTIVLVILFQAIPFPVEKLASWPVSPQVTDRTGCVLLTVTGEDEQWRYPVRLSQISSWLIQATIAIEDERFFSHHGIDPIAVLRATGQNMRALEVVSGASTLTMQICRMMDRRPRTWSAKAIESFRAVQLERNFDKDQIIETYLNIAPYGGNIRGVEAASRVYFSKNACDLSLSEAALLAGLPQSPSKYRPDRSPTAASARRDHVLQRMAELGLITERQLAIAAGETLEITLARRIPRAQHASWLALHREPAGGCTTIDLDIQSWVDSLITKHSKFLPSRSEAAVVIIEIATGDIVVMVGSPDFTNPVGGQNNGALARRSPGSALKPFIYAAAFEAGRLNRNSIIYDVSIQRAGWSPQNFNRTFAGKVTVADALRRSLNVPAILVAEGVGLDRCIGIIESVGINLSRHVRARAGLGVVVGAAEVTLLDLTNGYATLGRGGIYRPPRLLMAESGTSAPVIDANVCATIDDILSSRRRRPAGMEQFAPQDVPWFMWKTGTSSGRRDAWAAGHNHRFAIGVWIGRFSGAGHPRFVGAQVAEPLLAQLFSLPGIRNDTDPPTPKPRVVENPLPPPPEVYDSIQVLSPQNGAVFIAIFGKGTIHPRANKVKDVSWFLNGKYVAREHSARLSVRPGSYDLRCVDPYGRSSAVHFTVRAAEHDGS